MKKNILRRIAAFACTAVLSAGALAVFAGCTSNNPEVTITYQFMGTDYAVEYRLSRSSAPKTVQHFIDLADAGYYNGTCIHDYDGTFLYGGGYYYDENNELKEKDYFTVVKELEAAGHSFEQSVFTSDGNRTPLYTVYGEFTTNGCAARSAEYFHSQGALVMYYTDKTTSASDIDVLVERNDNGDNNGGEKEQTLRYCYNSATSLFYTFTGSTNITRDDNYAVFGKAINYAEQFQPMIDAINAYKDTLEDDETTEEEEDSFTRDEEQILDTLDHPNDPMFESVRKGANRVTFHVPIEPIIITSVVVNKY